MRDALALPGERDARFQRVAECLREGRGYRWVGIYEVAGDEIGILVWSGPGEPSHPRFSASQGLCGEAVRRRETVTVGDVSKDPRYLTAFGDTRSEIVVPVLNFVTGRARGLIDVESDRLNAFTGEDRDLLERCAAELARVLSPSPG